MTTATLLLLIAAVERPFDAWLVNSGYVFERGGGYYATERGRNVSWSTSPFTVPADSNFEAELVKFERGHFTSLPYRRNSPDYATKHPRNIALPSGWPLGRARYFSPGTTSSQVVAVVEDRIIFTKHDALLMRTNNGIRVRTTELNTEDARILEMVARWVTAEVAAKPYSSASANINGQNFSARRNAEGRVHIRAKDWAQRKGFTFRVNVGTACAVITRPTGDILLPLGSPKVKVGANWIDIDDVVLADGNEVMLPKQVLDRIGG